MLHASYPAANPRLLLGPEALVMMPYNIDSFSLPFGLAYIPCMLSNNQALPLTGSPVIGFISYASITQLLQFCWVIAYPVVQLLMTRPRDEWRHDVTSRYRALEQFSKEDARLQFLRILRSLPYGASPRIADLRAPETLLGLQLVLGFELVLGLQLC